MVFPTTIPVMQFRKWDKTMNYEDELDEEV